MTTKKSESLIMILKPSILGELSSKRHSFGRIRGQNELFCSPWRPLNEIFSSIKRRNQSLIKYLLSFQRTLQKVVLENNGHCAERDGLIELVPLCDEYEGSRDQEVPFFFPHFLNTYSKGTELFDFKNCNKELQNFQISLLGELTSKLHWLGCISWQK